VSAIFCNSIGRKNTLAAFKAMPRPVADIPYDLRCRLDAANETDALPAPKRYRINVVRVVTPSV